MEFDYVIVGAGSAGCVVADLLSRDGKNTVAVIEAGGSDRKFWVKVPMGYGRIYDDARLNWKFTTEPVPSCNNRSGYWPRGKVVGGSSSINALVYFRGLPQDFDAWQEAGATGWGWKDVAPHFEQIEHHIGIDGGISGKGPMAVSDVSDRAHPVNQHFLDAAVEAGLPVSPDFNGEKPEGVGYYPVTIKKGRRCSAADAFLRPALKRDNVTLLTRAMVQKIVFHGSRAVGVYIKRSGKSTQIRARKEVIVCAGAVGSPQLLQVSGIGPAEKLAALGIEVVVDNPNVGGHLQDHLAVTYYFQSTKPTLNNQLSSLAGKIWTGMKYMLARRGPLSLSVNQCGGFVRAGADAGFADTQLYFSPLTFGQHDPALHRRINPDPYAGFLLSFQPCRPTSEGRIDICSADIDQPPQIRPNSLTTQKDLDDVVNGGRLLQALLKTTALQDLISETVDSDVSRLDDAGILEDFRRRCSTVYHPVSTSRMGLDGKTSVVGPNLKVHGVSGLRVIDASAFPMLTSGNTNAPTMMLAHKAASDMLIEAALTQAQ